MAMMRTRGLVTIGAAAAFLVAACSGVTGDSGDGSESGGGDSGGGGEQEPVTITLGDLPSEKAGAQRKIVLDAVKKFEADNPNITVETTETTWANETYAAMLAGGTMPTVIGVPYTNTQQVIANQQVADITEAVEATGMVDQLNPDTLAHAEDGDGNIYGIPTQVDAISLVYNRSLFEDAGLDPDKPPTTWDDVRAAAQTITAETGEQGFLQVTESNQGGWIFTALLYAHGGAVQNEAGDEVQLDSPETREALHLLHDMYWDDQTMGKKAVHNIDTVLEEFAAGKVGMFIAPVASYEWIKNTYEMDLKDIGAAGLPQADGGPHGTLLGGKVQMFDPRASEAELEAAVKWVEFFHFNKYTDEATAVADAKAVKQDGGIVGLPRLSPLSDDAYEQYNGWIESERNVDAAQFAPYVDSLPTLPLIPEPTTRAQEAYAEVAPMVQAVLSKQSADIDTLISDAVSRIERVVSQ